MRKRGEMVNGSRIEEKVNLSQRGIANKKCIYSFTFCTEFYIDVYNVYTSLDKDDFFSIKSFENNKKNTTNSL